MSEVLEPEDDELDAVPWAIWTGALRSALDATGAASRCNRRACRVAGDCRMRGVPGEPLVCGGGLTDEVLDKAAFAVMIVLAVSPGER